jgi:hypothetical protein
MAPKLSIVLSITVLCVAVALLTACYPAVAVPTLPATATSVASGTSAATQPAPTAIVVPVAGPTAESRGTAVPAPLATAVAPGTMAPSEENTPMNGSPTSGPGVDAAANPAVADLSQRTGLAAGQIQVLSVEPVTWNDGSLGCPKPGMMYTQALVNGLRIRLQAGGVVYEYHSGGNRPPFLCENPAP